MIPSLAWIFRTGNPDLPSLARKLDSRELFATLRWCTRLLEVKIQRVPFKALVTSTHPPFLLKIQ